MTNLNSILKSRNITLPTKVCLVKAMVFLVVMYGCVRWTIKKAQHRRTDAFELWCWRRLLRVPWTARRSNQSIVPCLFLICFLTCIQVSQEAGKVVWYSHLFKNFPQFVVIHTVKGFSVVNEAEVVYLEFSCFFDDPTDAGNFNSGSSAFSKFSLNIWKFLVHILLKPSLENLEHYFTSMRDECNCGVV